MAWLAGLSLLLAACGPTLTHLLAAASGNPALLTEICTASGVSTVAPGKGKPAQSAKVHCPFCCMTDGSGDVPLPLSLALRVSVVRLAPRITPSLCRAALVWDHAQARGPPSALAA